MPRVIAALAILLTGCAAPRTVTTNVHDSYGASSPALDENGDLLPLVKLDLDTHVFPVAKRLDLPDGNAVEIRSDVPWLSAEEIEEIGARAAACYAFVEEETARTVPGDTLLLLVPVDRSRHSYSMSYTPPPGEQAWAWVGLVPFESSDLQIPIWLDPLWNDCGVTLVHELTEHLLGASGKIAQDEVENTHYRTRWFFDGTADAIAYRFAMRDDPKRSREYYEGIRSAAALEDPEIRATVFDWMPNGYVFGRDTGYDPPKRILDYYAASLWLVDAWLRHASLAQILDRIDREPAAVDGEGLRRILMATAGLTPDELIAEAR